MHSVRIFAQLNFLMHPDYEKIKRLLSFRNIILPVLLGIVAALYLLLRNFDISALEQAAWVKQSYLWLGFAVIMIVLRQLAYMYRIRLLTDCRLSWRKSFDVIALWEFASTVTPTVVGGSAVAVYIVHREGISTGRSTALVLITAFLDELFFVVVMPLIWLFTGSAALFRIQAQASGWYTGWGISGIFWAGYGIIILITLLIAYGIFFNPHGFRRLLIRLFKIRMLRRWKDTAAQTGDDIVITSAELKGKPVSFWLKAFLSTSVTWSARFLIVNAMLMMFVPVADHLIVYARHMMIWIILLVTPTPGGSGVAELIFGGFLGDQIPGGLSQPLAVLWRLMTYYPYIIVGLIILPMWLKRVFGKTAVAAKANLPS